MRISGYCKILLGVLLFLMACKKQTWEITDVHKEIKGSDPTASIYQIEAYIYNLYIALTGRKPDAQEFATARQDLIAAQADRVSRVAFVRTLLDTDEFYDNLYALMRKDILDNIDTMQITREYQEVLDFLAAPQFRPLWPRFEEMKLQYEMLMRSPQDLKNETIGISGLYRRGVHNEVYDEINMGSENFVVSCFTFFLGRYPTEEELEESKKMVDSRNAVLFLQTGSHKQDFLDIFFASQNYKEGLIRRLFSRYLFREPSSYERDIYIERLSDDREYKELLIALFSSDEYYRQQ